MLGDEYGTASNIKSRVNRLSVLSAITSAQQRLKLYNKVRHQQQATHGVVLHHWAHADPNPHAPMLLQLPGNGLVVYTGTILTDDGKEKKVNIDFEPFKPINTSLYMCDNKFHTEALSELLESDNK
jgi:peptide chain release factor subunit 1